MGGGNQFWEIASWTYQSLVAAARSLIPSTNQPTKNESPYPCYQYRVLDLALMVISSHRLEPIIIGNLHLPSETMVNNHDF